MIFAFCESGSDSLFSNENEGEGGGGTRRSTWHAGTSAYQIDVSCAPSRKMIVFLRTRRKRGPTRDTEINAILRGAVTPLATAGVFASVKHVHGGGRIKFAYVQIERRACLLFLFNSRDKLDGR